jgi:acetyl-CoA carboxylase biotin carboxylase subunit
MTGERHIRKVLIANRGEIAVRILRTCRDLGIRTVAVYSDADRAMPHVLKADEAYRIGTPPSRESYLVMERLIDVAKRAGADAIHPGYGFLSENALFAGRVQEAGLIWIGPPPESIRAMGDKTEARKLVSKAGVPTVPGTEEPVTTEQQAASFCSRAGFPVLLKAAAGGGGKGMRIVRRPDELAPSLRAAQSEATSAFGDGRVYIEKYLENPRHIEFQILADQHGHIVHLGERECSIQRRHQKVIEETPSVIVSPAMREAMGRTAVEAARACGYTNAGPIEFLVDGERNFYFLEMNTRLQVEHPVTELRTGTDLVALQLHVAAGKPLPFTQEQVEFRGHAIECRICAEDVDNDFLPSIGKIRHLRAPGGPGIREDRGVEEGGEIPVFYDSMISKLIAWGPTREYAIRRMEGALAEYQILGVKTNIPLCLFVLRHPAFREGNFTTHFIKDHFHPGQTGEKNEWQQQAVALVCAMLEQQGFDNPPHGNATQDGQLRSGWKSKKSSFMRS